MASKLTDRQAAIVGWTFATVVGLAWLGGLARWPQWTLLATGIVYAEEWFRLSRKHGAWPWRRAHIGASSDTPKSTTQGQ